jgi:hypothetical protein
MMVCVAFAGIYLAYWATILSTLRYAILPFAILSLLVSQAAVRFYDSRVSGSNPLVRYSVLAAEMYGLLIAALGIIMIEIQSQQISYFAGQLDKPAYLRAGLETYGALEYLQKSATEGDVIFGIDNCSRAYSPNPLQFQCTLCSLGGCAPKELTARLHDYKPRYVIVPEDKRAQTVIDSIHLRQGWTRVFQDTRFSVYRRD